MVCFPAVTGFAFTRHNDHKRLRARVHVSVEIVEITEEESTPEYGT